MHYKRVLPHKWMFKNWGTHVHGQYNSYIFNTQDTFLPELLIMQCVHLVRCIFNDPCFWPMSPRSPSPAQPSIPGGPSCFPSVCLHTWSLHRNNHKALHIKLYTILGCAWFRHTAKLQMKVSWKRNFLDMTEVFKGFWKQDEFTKLLSSKVHNAQHHHSPELNILQRASRYVYFENLVQLPVPIANFSIKTQVWNVFTIFTFWNVTFTSLDNN